MTTPTIPFECTPALGRLLDAAKEMADAAGAVSTGTEHILLAMLRDLSAVPVAELEAMGLEPVNTLTQLAILVHRQNTSAAGQAISVQRRA
ncbi:MAG: hypothetical protein JWN03_181 [Nocardia sp.]|uniref:hypothetical protein n=1 Tax=Nocardia sp. TaxID=1821 RepID=UPI00260C3F1A|nr:hypothetical protein [Nocardia sp.]MCU1639906.1 hypothetical protein [Nocardia sp.]